LETRKKKYPILIVFVDVVEIQYIQIHAFMYANTLYAYSIQKLIEASLSKLYTSESST